MGSSESTSVSSDDQPRRVGLIYDDRMCKHSSPDDDYHPENPNRVRAIWNKLQSSGIHQRCVVFNAQEAEDKHIASVHTKKHIDLIKTISSNKFDSQRHKIAAKFNSIYFNEGSSEAAHLAAGSVIEVAEKVAKGELNSAFAIVRPPGHHAEEDEPMGFCLYNNVAIATRFLLNERAKLGINKILIVDWDVHHGNGTQKMFWKDPRVLFFSVHRYDFGSFYPAGDDGSHIMTGEEPGVGYNINVPWESGRCGDADYLAVWDHILIPVAKEFNPDMIMISAGFDAAINDPLGGCCVTPYGYSVMLNKLMEFAGGKIVMALEGGYNLDSLANSVLACVEVLLEDKPVTGSYEAYPFESTWRVIEAVRAELNAFWPALAEKLPEKLPSRKTPQIQISSSDSEGEHGSGPEKVTEDLEEAVIQPFAELKVAEYCYAPEIPLSPWRSELAMIYVWYAAYGSNMDKSRFRCYIKGGKVEGMRRTCSGSRDRSQPKKILWKTLPHRLFFGREHTGAWGPGGAAFLHPESNVLDKAYLCLYKITLEQFNDVLVQENGLNHDMTSPLFDLTALDSLASKRSISVEVRKRGWYRNVVYLGKEEGVSILTMTCTLSDIERFKSGKVAMCTPAKEYVNTLVRGLVEGKQLSKEEARAYIKEASTKAL
ncbi:unnamed protein product [Ilex paraguariensis]|uniref:histone deacetylase n=1 Tax=Ilex paraguariensis TaxID=185542 RepID=A0ABC8RZ08_9AQUA